MFLTVPAPSQVSLLRDESYRICCRNSAEIRNQADLGRNISFESKCTSLAETTLASNLRTIVLSPILNLRPRLQNRESDPGAWSLGLDENDVTSWFTPRPGGDRYRPFQTGAGRGTGTWSVSRRHSCCCGEMGLLINK